MVGINQSALRYYAFQRPHPIVKLRDYTLTSAVLFPNKRRLGQPLSPRDKKLEQDMRLYIPVTNLLDRMP